MSELKSKPKFYPLKPENAKGFKKAVAWFGGREFIASLKGIVMYAIYGENMDPRSWMKPNIYPNVEEKVRFQREDKVENKIKKAVEEEVGDYQPPDATVKTAVAEKIKDSKEIQQEIAQKVNSEWAKKVFDYWEWKRTHFGFWEKYLEKAEFWENLKGENKQIDEFWFDFIADSGDGQMGVYGVGCMRFSDLWLKIEKPDSKTDSKAAEKAVGEKTSAKKNTTKQTDPSIKFEPPKIENAGEYMLLPRGYFLFVGGDTAYHSANYATLFERFQTPFRWAFTSVRKYLFNNYEPALDLNENKFILEGKEELISTKVDGTEKLNENWDGTISGETNIPVKTEDSHNNESDVEIIKKKYWDTEPPRPFFGIPANHDYYDSLDGFNRQFRRPPFEDVEENRIYDDNKGKTFLQIPTFSREQEASYIAIRLPFEWWMFGIDSENEKLDFRQEVFFRQIMERKPKKLILATPEPTTVFGKKSSPAEKTTTYLKTITDAFGLEQPFLTDGKLVKIENGPAQNESLEGYCRLDLSGDVHHYARYWGEDFRGFDNQRFASNSYASLVAGGGGAFFDTTSTLIGEARGENGEILRDKDDKKGYGEIPPQKLYPSAKESINRTADKIFDLWNIKKGGYIQSGGVVFAWIIFFFLTQFSNVSESFTKFEKNIETNGFRVAAASSWQSFNDLIRSAFRVSANGFGDFLISFGKPISGVILVAVIILTGFCAWKLNQLIKELKEKSSEENFNKTAEEELMKLGRIWNLVKTSAPFFIAVALYVLFVLINVLPFVLTNEIPSVLTIEIPSALTIEAIAPLNNELTTYKSVFLLFHIIIALLLIWLSFEYTNWLAVRFKLARKSPRKTFTERLEDPNEKADDFF